MSCHLIIYQIYDEIIKPLRTQKKKIFKIDK